jgi:hypothetical protein
MIFLTPAETELMRKTASDRMPIMVDRIVNGAKPQPPQTSNPNAWKLILISDLMTVT